MQRRDFLTTAAAGVLAAAAVRPGFAQGGGGGGRGGGRGQGDGQKPIPPLGNPKPYPRSPKAARIAMMTLNFASWVKDIPDVNPGPQRTLAFFDLPQMVADVYDVHLIEFQNQHFESNSPAYFKSLRAALAKSKSEASQINANFQPGIWMSAPTVNARLQAIALTKDCIDQAVMLGAKRVMCQQAHGSLGWSNLPQAAAAFKEMADYGRSKNIIVSVETRGGGAPIPPAVPPPDVPQPGLETWKLLAELIKRAGAYANPDVGNANAMNQEQIHQCLSKELMFPTAGSMHCRVNQNWDLTTACKYVLGLGYTGIFTPESNQGHAGTMPIYDAVMAAL
jgi:hypothetical protein